MFQRFGKWAHAAFVIAVPGLGLDLAGCAELGWNPLDPTYLPPEARVELPVPEALSFDLETLSEVPARYEAVILEDPLTGDRRRIWRGDENSQPQASLLLRHSLTDRPVVSPQDPRDAMAYWPDIAWRSLDFKTLYETSNNLGPAQWRRFVMGPFTCVVLQQQVQQTVLAGFYCSPAGEELTEGQAETVAQSVRFVEGPASPGSK